MYIKLHKSYRTVVAICDSDLIGKRFEEGTKQLDIRENFYKGEEVNSEKAVKMLQNQANRDATFNIVGKESINKAIEAGIITKNNVSKIQGIPFTLVLI